MRVPIASSTGRTPSKTSRSPPSMMERAAFCAPSTPPLTGASSIGTPRSASAAPTVRVTSGEMVLMSMTTVPAAAPWMTPPSPRMTACTSGESVTIVITTSAPAAASCGDDAASPPSATKASTLDACAVPGPDGVARPSTGFGSLGRPSAPVQQIPRAWPCLLNPACLQTPLREYVQATLRRAQGERIPLAVDVLTPRPSPARGSSRCIGGPLGPGRRACPSPDTGSPRCASARRRRRPGRWCLPTCLRRRRPPPRAR